MPRRSVVRNRGRISKQFRGGGNFLVIIGALINGTYNSSKEDLVLKKDLPDIKLEKIKNPFLLIVTILIYTILISIPFYLLFWIVNSFSELGGMIIGIILFASYLIGLKKIIAP